MINKDQIKGCMYGLAIGDALGYPVEFMSLEQIKKVLGPEGVRGFDSIRNPKIARNISQPIGTYSDDTQMALATARGLINAKSFETEDVADSINAEYIKWADSPENNRAPGNTCMSGIANLKAGIPWYKSGIRCGKGCGAAMRIAPIGLKFSNDIHLLREIAYVSSVCTHKDPGAYESAIATAKAVADIVTRRDIFSSDSNVRENIIFGINMTIKDNELRGKIDQLENLLKNNVSEGEALERLGNGWIGVEAVPMALYCFLKNPSDFKKSVLDAVNINGDSDSVACITGALSGAYNGFNRLPSKWVEQIREREAIDSAIDGLLK